MNRSRTFSPMFVPRTLSELSVAPQVSKARYESVGFNPADELVQGPRPAAACGVVHR